MARCKHYDEAFDCCAKMSEFIEDLLLVKSCYYKDDVCPNCRYFEEKEDVVPVVRCKDCKYYEIHKPSVTLNCERGGRLVPMMPDDYCSYGDAGVSK